MEGLAVCSSPTSPYLNGKRKTRLLLPRPHLSSAARFRSSSTSSRPPHPSEAFIYRSPSPDSSFRTSSAAASPALLHCVKRSSFLHCCCCRGKGEEGAPCPPPDVAWRNPSEKLGPDAFAAKAARIGYLVMLCMAGWSLTDLIFAHPVYAAVKTAASQTGGAFTKNEIVSSACTGFLAGCLHTLSGPDHLVALAPLSIGRTKIESAIVGALWGCGHDAGQLIFGLLFLLLKDRLHIEFLRTWGTRVVGITLLVIGGMGIREASQVPTPCVALDGGECDVSVMETLEPVPSGKKIGFATFATGIVHGLQPDALLMILPALALPSRLAGAAFLGMFLVGTVVAMGSYTVFIGSFSQALKDRVPRVTEKLTWASSLLAIFMGLGILVSPFFGFSLY